MADETWPVPTPRDEVFARVVTRGRRIQMLNRLAIGGAAAVGAAALVGGVLLGVSGAVDLVGDDGGAPAVVTPDGGEGPDGAPTGVAYFACPNERPLGELHGGDRIYLTGRDDSGDWVELRSPTDAGIPVWVRAEVVDPDGDADLPEVDCDLTELALGVTTTTLPDEELPEETTTTTEADDPTAPTTAAPGPGPGPTPTTQPPVVTTQPPMTTTTQPPAPPVIGTISRNPSVIVEEWAGFPDTCGGAKSSSISVTIPGATSATLSWNFGPNPRSMAMSRQGQTFSGTVGPFDENALAGGSTAITVTVSASGPGGSDSRSTTVTLNDCPFG